MENNLRIRPFVAFGSVQHGSFESIDNFHAGFLCNLRVEIIFVVRHQKNVVVRHQKSLAIHQHFRDAGDIRRSGLSALAAKKRSYFKFVLPFKTKQIVSIGMLLVVIDQADIRRT